MITAIIIEDEEIAAVKLQNMVQELDSEIHIARILSSVKDSIAYLQNNEPDVIFLDINLSDDNSFEIFNTVKNINSKIIFTTAYSEYAIKAFEQNSIDYLLKPIPKDALKRSLEKIRKYNNSESLDYGKLLLHPNNVYKKRFLIKLNNSLKTVEINQIAYFYSEDKVTFIKLKDSTKLPVEFSLKHLEALLNPKEFFRINRKYIVHIKSISKMYYSSKSKIVLHLNPAIENEQVSVAIEKIGKFKKWLSQ